jgi:uncharacterized membrane protein
MVTLGALDKTDEKQLKEMLEKHLEYTGSDRSGKLLESFTESVKAFVKVIPNDYQDVLRALEEAKRQNIAAEEQPLYAFNLVVSAPAAVLASAAGGKAGKSKRKSNGA